MTPLIDAPLPIAPQQVFDAVVAHAAGMTSKSLFDPKSRSSACAYRAPDGNACFVGCLLTDREAAGCDRPYDPLSVRELYREGLLPERLNPHRDLLHKLQEVHDSYDIPD